MDRQRLAIEEPGVLAGFSHKENLPAITGSKNVASMSYRCCPLHTRMDVDRVFRAMRESELFHHVWPYGSGTGDTETVYKEKPWAHLNCYKLRCKLTIDSPMVEVGAT